MKKASMFLQVTKILKIKEEEDKISKSVFHSCLQNF